MAQLNTSLRREYGGRTIWHQYRKSGQFGTKQVNRQFGTKIRKWTIWHWNTYLALDNLAPKYFGTNIVKQTYPAQSKKIHQIDYLTTLFPFCSCKRALKHQIITFISKVWHKDPERSMFSSSLWPIKYKGFLFDGIRVLALWKEISQFLLDELAIHFGLLRALYLLIKEKNHQFIFSFFCPDDYCHSSDIEGWRIFH